MSNADPGWGRKSLSLLTLRSPEVKGHFSYMSELEGLNPGIGPMEICCGTTKKQCSIYLLSHLVCLMCLLLLPWSCKVFLYA